MPWDSLVRTKQLNQPELSGYIVGVLLQYLKTGAVTGIAMNTGQLTGQFYPLSQNPSGYVTTGQLTGLATQLQVSGNNTFLQSWTDINYYPRSNPSGYIGASYLSTGLMPKSGACFAKSESFTLTNNTYQPVLAMRPENYWYLTDLFYGGVGPYGAAINFYGLNNQANSYISGFDIWTNKINGYAALDSGDINNLYVSWDYFTEAKGYSLPFVFLSNNNSSLNYPSLSFGNDVFLLAGGQFNVPDQNYFIDMVGRSAQVFGMTYNKPLMYGLDIISNSVKVTGFDVLTTDTLKSLTPLSTFLTASGTLQDEIDSIVVGSVSMTGAGSVTVYQSGTTFVISGANSGQGGGVLNDTGQYLWTTGGTQNIYGYKNFRGPVNFYGPLNTFGWVAINDLSNNVAADMTNRTLYDGGENFSIDWMNRYLYSNNVTISVDWKLGRLKGVTDGDIRVDWDKRLLSGTWNVDGLTISGNKALTGGYLLASAGTSVTLQNMTGRFNVSSGFLQVSGVNVTTGGPWYPRSSNPSGYIVATGLQYATDDFDPQFFKEYSGVVVPPVVDISITTDITNSNIATARYILQVQAYQTGYFGRIVYSQLLSSGICDNPGGYDMMLNWNPPNYYYGNFILTVWEQVYGGGAPYGLFATGGYCVSPSVDKNGALLSSFTWLSGTSGNKGPFGAMSAYVTWTGQYVQNLNVTGRQLSGSLALTGIGGLNVFASGSTIVFSGGGSQSGPNSSFSGNYVSGIFVSGVYQTGVVTLTGIGGVQVATSGTWITISGGSVGNTGQFVDSSMTGQFAPEYIGLPTDGAYGGSQGPIAGIKQGDRHEDAFDKIETILGKLAPPLPLALNVATFGFTGATYSANMQGTQTLFTNVMNNTQPTGYVTGFYDPEGGILSGYINGTMSGVRTLWTGSEIGTYSGLSITNEYDYWFGVAGKAGFWYCLNAQLAPMVPTNTGIIVMCMGHSTQGMTPAITGYVDTPKLPTATFLSTGTGIGMCSFRWVDGIISLAAGDSIFSKFSGMNAVGPFYNPNFSQLTASPYLSATAPSPTGFPMSGANLLLSGYQTVQNNQYSTGIPMTVTVYNSSNQNGQQTITTNFRMDTVSSQQAQRHTAGTGRFISGGYNVNYDNTINISGNEELQMINGQIQHPPKVDYRNFIPSGYNYGFIQTGTYSGCRWAMFDMGPITNNNTIQFTFNNTANFGATPIIPNFLMYVRVSGATAGWVNGNAAYAGVGNPTLDDTPALVIGNSTATVRQVTFGSTVLSGPVYLRVGIPSGSNMAFGSVSMTVIS